jgi:hypothetical protein
VEGAANIGAMLREHSPSARNVLTAYHHPIRWLRHHKDIEKHQRILGELSAAECDGFSLKEQVRDAMRTAARKKAKSGIKTLAACERECELAIEKTGVRNYFSSERFGELTLAVFNAVMRQGEIDSLNSGRRLENWFIGAGAALGIVWAFAARNWGEGGNFFVGGAICFLAAGIVSKLQTISEFARQFLDAIANSADEIARQR